MQLLENPLAILMAQGDVLRNEIGYTMTVFYDAISESITGYGLDPDVYRSETFLSSESTYQEAYVYDG